MIILLQCLNFYEEFEKYIQLNCKADCAILAFSQGVEEPVWSVDADILQEGETVSSLEK